MKISFIDLTLDKIAQLWIGFLIIAKPTLQVLAVNIIVILVTAALLA